MAMSFGFKTLPSLFLGFMLGAYAGAVGLIAESSAAQAQELPRPTAIVEIPMRDGVKIAAAIYLPAGAVKVPALLAASPYRFDNDQVPAQAVFLWRETGPIDYYVAHGYAFVRVDVRNAGTGSSLARAW
jgi:predicted acyl esterase